MEITSPNRPLAHRTKWILVSLGAAAAAALGARLYLNQPPAPEPQIPAHTGAAPVVIQSESYGDVAFSPDSRRLAIGMGIEPDAEVQLFDARSGSLLGRLKTSWLSDSASGMAWSPNGKRFATSDSETTKGPVLAAADRVTLWDVASRKPTRVFPYAAPGEEVSASVLWAPDGKLWGNGFPPALFDARTGKRLRRFGLEGNKVFYGAQFNADQSLVLQTDVDKGLTQIFGTASGRLVRTIRTSSWLHTFWSREPNVLAVRENVPHKQHGVRRARLSLLNVRTGRAFSLPPLQYAASLDFGPGGTLALVSNDDVKEDNNFIYLKAGADIGGDVAGIYTTRSSRLLVWDYHRGKMLWTRSLSRGSKAWTWPAGQTLVRWAPTKNRLLLLQSRCAPQNEGLNVFSVLDGASGRETWKASEKPWPWTAKNIFKGEMPAQWSPDSRKVALKVPQQIHIFSLG